MRSSSAEVLEERDEASRQDPPPVGCRSMPAATEPGLEFGRFRVSQRRRELFADGAPVKLGTRAFDVLMVLLEADGALVTKAELLRRAWSGIAVSEDNLKVQIADLRRALAGDRDLIRTEFGRGYRLIAAVRRTEIGVPTGLPAVEAADPSAGPEAAGVSDLAVIAAQLAALEAKLASALSLWTRQRRRADVRLRRRRSSANLTARSNRFGRHSATSATTVDKPRKVSGWGSPL
jgi:DNA-binding winged helix-turn-helix (wHTH) protein